MIYLKKFFESQILGKFVRYKSLVRNFSAEECLNIENTAKKERHKKENWISSFLTTSRIQEIKSVTGIVAGIHCVAWIKMSVPELVVVEWKLKMLPEDFGKRNEELKLLEVAHDITDSLPKSDLYVMESLSMVESKRRLTHYELNRICLVSILIGLLSTYDKGKCTVDSVIFQKRFVVNYLFNVQIAAERIRTKSRVENIILNSKYAAHDSDFKDIFSKTIAPIQIDDKYIKLLNESELEKQEYLSLAFLLTLSFIDVNLFKNPTSIEKIKKKLR